MTSAMPSTSSRSDDAITTAWPCVAKAADQAIDVGPRADIDAARRLVHQQHAGVLAARSTRPNANFCWLPPRQFVGARERSRAAIDADGRGERAARRAASASRERKPSGRMLGELRRHQVLTDAEAEKDPLAGPILGDELHAARLRPRAPSAAAAVAPRPRHRRLHLATSPASARSASVAPEPTWPARQTTVPRSASSSNRAPRPARQDAAPSASASPRLPASAGYISPMVRPSIISMSARDRSRRCGACRPARRCATPRPYRKCRKPRPADG